MIGIVTYFVILKPEPEDVRAFWQMVSGNGQMYVDVGVVNKGNKEVNVTRVELIYLPDETLGLIWIEHRTLKSAKEGKYGYWCELFTWNLIEEEVSQEQLDFFNLLHKDRTKDIVKIIVETDNKIYTYYPLRTGYGVTSSTYTKPTSIEEK